MTNEAPSPGVKPAPLVRFLDDSVGGTVDVWKAHGDLAVFPAAGRSVYFAVGPAHARQVFAHPDQLHLSFGLPGPRNSDQRAFTRGVFGINGPHHQFVRSLLLPAFRKPVVEGHQEALTECVREVTAPWRAGQTRDLYRDMKALSLLMTDRLLFGGGDLELSQRVDEAFDAWLSQHHRVSFASLFSIEADSGAYDQLLASAEHLAGLLRQLIAACRRNARAETPVARLLAAQATGELTEQDILGLVHSLFNAAHHTVTASLSWTLFLISQHPEVNADLLDELAEQQTGAEGSRLLDRVIRESLRILPPPVYVCRQATEPLQFGTTPVPTGSIVVLGVYATHHSSGSYPQPEKFDPNRWLALKTCPHSHVAFGGGARMCLGAPLATLFLETALRAIVPRFRLTVVPGSRIDRRASLTLRPFPGIPVLLRDQDRQFSTSPVAGAIREMVELPSAGSITRAA